MFFELRDVPGLKKKPSTSELLDWLKLLLAEDIPPEALRSSDKKVLIPPLHGALLKNEQDVHLFERVAFMARAGRGSAWRFIEPVTLDGQHVRRSSRWRARTRRRIAEALAAPRPTASCGGSGTRASPPPDRMRARTSTTALDMRERLGAMPFVVRGPGERRRSSAARATSTSRRRNRRLEIGHTWYRASACSARRSTPSASCCC